MHASFIPERYEPSINNPTSLNQTPRTMPSPLKALVFLLLLLFLSTIRPKNLKTQQSSAILDLWVEENSGTVSLTVEITLRFQIHAA